MRQDGEAPVPSYQAEFDGRGSPIAANDNHPLVTIITPTYNRAGFIAETIESILSQDYPSVEYIVVDDGSTDDTPAIVRRYGDLIRYAYHPNMGEAPTINRGFELATGAIIGVVSSDDTLRTGAISTMVRALLEHPDAVVVYPDWDLIDVNGETIRHIPTLEFSSFVDMLRWSFAFPGAGALFRRSVVEQTGGRDPSIRYLSDLDFWFRAGLVGPFRRVPQTLATWRTHPTSQSVEKRGPEMSREYVTILDNLYARDDLLPEVIAVKMEAYRNAWIRAGLSCNVGPWTESERYQIHDTLHTRMFEPESRNLLETVTWLHREVAERDATISWLHAEVAERDRTVVWLHGEVARRDTTVVELQGEISQLRDELGRVGGTKADLPAIAPVQIERDAASQPMVGEGM